MFERREAGLIATASALVFSRVFGLSLVLPNFRGHYEGEFAVAGVWIGLAFGAYGLTMALMQLPAGLLSDRWGRRRLLFVSSAFFVAGSVAAAYATSIEMLVAARLVQGLGAIASVAMAAVGDTVPAERRTLAMMFVGIPAGAGFLVGMGAGPLLYPSIGMEGLFLTTAFVAALPMLAVPWVHVGAPRPRDATTGQRHAVLALAFAGFVSNYALTTTLFFLPTSDWQTLLPLLAVALLLVGGLSRAIDRRGWTTQPIAVGVVAIAGAASAFVLAGGIVALVFGGLFFTAHATLQSTLPSQVSRIAGPAGGRGHGVQNLVAYLGTFVAGPVAGYFAAQAGMALAVLAGLAVVAAILAWRAAPQV